MILGTGLAGLAVFSIGQGFENSPVSSALGIYAKTLITLAISIFHWERNLTTNLYSIHTAAFVEPGGFQTKLNFCLP